MKEVMHLICDHEGCISRGFPHVVQGGGEHVADERLRSVQEENVCTYDNININLQAMK